MPRVSGTCGASATRTFDEIGGRARPFPWELMTVLEAGRRGLIWREIAVLLRGAERVTEEWWPGGWMHGRVNRRWGKVTVPVLRP